MFKIVDYQVGNLDMYWEILKWEKLGFAHEIFISRPTSLSSFSIKRLKLKINQFWYFKTFQSQSV